MNNEIREEIAALCHEQWSKWMDYLYSKSELNDDGSITIPPNKTRRWARQACTAYHNLSELERDGDREEADKFIEVFLRSDNDA